MNKDWHRIEITSEEAAVLDVVLTKLYAKTKNTLVTEGFVLFVNGDVGTKRIYGVKRNHEDEVVGEVTERLREHFPESRVWAADHKICVQYAEHGKARRLTLGEAREYIDKLKADSWAKL